MTNTCWTATPRDSSRKSRKKEQEPQLGPLGVEAKGVKVKRVAVKAKEKAKAKVRVKEERKVEKEKENGINGISSHMGETPLSKVGETPLLNSGKSCKVNAENGYFMVIAAADINAPWTTIQTEKVLEKEKVRKVKEKEKRKEKEAKRANQEVRKVARRENQELSNDLGLPPGGRHPLVPHQMARLTNLLANFS